MIIGFRSAALGAAFSVLATGFCAAGEAASDAAVTDFKLFGRFMYDYTHQTSRNTAFERSEPEVRRARVGFSAKLFDTAKIKAEINTDDSGDVEFTDAYLSFEPGGSPASIMVGHFKTPNSIDEWGSSRVLTGLERPAFTDAFDFDRRVGVALSGGGERSTYFLGVYGQNLYSDAVFGGFAVGGRYTYSPDAGDDMQTHVGASFRYRAVDDDQADMRYRQKAVTHVAGRILSTGNIAESDLFVGLEAALVRKSFWAVGEYGVTFAECAACASDPTFDGGYIEAGLMFGGQRTLKDGKFDKPQIGDHPLGAVSMFVRFDSIDLKDVGVNGGAYDAVVGGVEWWPRDNLHIGVNGFFADARLGAVTSGLDPVYAAAVTSGLTEDRMSGLLARAQFHF